LAVGLRTALPISYNLTAGGGRVWDMITMPQFVLIAAAKDPENGVDAEKPS
jgi:hypothetical protein